MSRSWSSLKAELTAAPYPVPAHQNQPHHNVLHTHTSLESPGVSSASILCSRACFYFGVLFAVCVCVCGRCCVASRVMATCTMAPDSVQIVALVWCSVRFPSPPPPVAFNKIKIYEAYRSATTHQEEVVKKKATKQATTKPGRSRRASPKKKKEKKSRSGHATTHNITGKPFQIMLAT